MGARWNFVLAAWFAPVFAMRLYRNSEKGGRAFLWLWLAYAVPTVIAWSGATAMGFLHPMAEPLVFVFLAAPISLAPYVVDRLYYRRWAQDGLMPFWLTLGYPISATSMNFFSKGAYRDVKEKPPFSPGYDVVGVVDELGAGA